MFPLPGAAAEAASVLSLLAILAFAIVRPRSLPEAVLAVPAAALLVLTGVVPVDELLDVVRELGPTVAFLAVILVLAHLCQAEGLFAYGGQWMAERARGDPRRLLVLVFLIASLTTAVLSLDATVVLLTPVVLATAVRVGADAEPHVYATAHLANAASLLLPVSNLTNLLAYRASGLSFGRFAALMALPWLVAIAVDYAVIRLRFARQLRARPRSWSAGDAAGRGGTAGRVDAGGRSGTGRRSGVVGRSGRAGTAQDDAAGSSAVEAPAPPLAALIVVGGVLVGFAACSPLGIDVVWPATAGVAILLALRLARPGRERTPAGADGGPVPGAGAVPGPGPLPVANPVAGSGGVPGAGAGAVPGAGAGPVPGSGPVEHSVAGPVPGRDPAPASRLAELAACLRATNLPFLAFVLALGIVVRGAVDHGLADLARRVLPTSTVLLDVIGIAVLAAVLANLVNNLPATLLLVPLVAPVGPVAVLAALIGVNVGPNLTYVGSLATLLWRRVLAGHGRRSDLAEFTRLGLLTVPLSLLACSTALWAVARLLIA